MMKTRSNEVVSIAAGFINASLVRNRLLFVKITYKMSSCNLLHARYPLRQGFYF